MAKVISKDRVSSVSDEVRINLLLVHFKDESQVLFIYAPHLDLTGYGENLVEAKKSFDVVFQDFIDFTIENKTLTKVLNQLGWRIKSNSKDHPELLTPGIETIIGQNEFVSEIFNKYSVKTYHQKVSLPLVA